MKKVKILLAVLFLLTSGVCIGMGQAHLFEHHKNRFFYSQAQVTTLSSGKQLKHIVFGFDNLVADIFWMRAIQYVGDNARYSEFPILEGYANTITDLDPNFSYAYHFAGILLPEVEKYEAAEAILLKGEQNVPTDWQVSWDLGFLYFYYLEENEKAIAAYDRCMQKEGCLSGAPRLKARLQAEQGKEIIAFENLWEQLKFAEQEEAVFLEQKLEEIGKLAILQETAKEHPSINDIHDFIGKPISSDPEVQEIAYRLEGLLKKKIVSSDGTLLAEMLESPYESNPYIWDAENQKVRPIKWME